MLRQTSDIITPAMLDFLVSPQGSDCLHFARDLDPTKPMDIAKLRKSCTREETSAVLELVELRHRARSKFSLADVMFFDRKGYEQSSGEELSLYKSSRIKSIYSGGQILDLCCGIGGDMIGFSKVAEVLGVDSSASRIRCAELNLKAYHQEKQCSYLCSDVTAIKLESRLFHLDPDQRTAGRRRTFDVNEITPPVSWINELIERIPTGVIKFSPAMNHETLPWSGESELISYKGENRQLLLWMGELAGVKLRATCLPSGSSITDTMDVRFTVSGILDYLYDPDPSVSRLRLLGQLAAEMELNFLSPGQIVLTSDKYVAHPMAKAYKVREVIPFHLDKVKKWFKEKSFGVVTVKPRGVDINVDKVSRDLSSSKGDEAFLFLLRLDKKVLAVITSLVNGAM